MTGVAGATPGWLLYTSRTAYTAEVAEIIWRRGENVEVLVDNMPDAPRPSPLGRVITRSDIGDGERSLPVAIAITAPGYVYRVVAEARALGLTRFPALVDPTSVVARTASMGEGCVVNAMAMIGANSCLGDFVHVNRTASIGHDAQLFDYVTLGPRCVLAGFITVESGAFIGAGAVIAPRVRIGANATVGAGAVVIRDVPERAVVAGNPAKVIREDSAGFEGVAVPVSRLSVHDAVVTVA